jgi:hypothetical protein
MSIRNRLKRLERSRPQCGSGPWSGMVAYRSGGPEPTVPTCPNCGQFHGVVVEEVIVRTRGEALAVMER